MLVGHKTYQRQSLFLVFFVCTLVASILIVRLGYLMLTKADYYGVKAKELHERERTIKAERGKILDRNGNVLAGNVSVSTISVIHSQVKEPEKVISVLSKELGIEEAEIRKKVEKISSREKIKSNVEKEISDRIRAYKLAGVTVDEDYKRYYEYGTLASKVLGFTGGDNQGIVGLEVSYESLLKGLDGKDGADGINGKDGADGKDGTNGQNGSDGKDGKTPFIGENGNWWIGEIDTGIKAAGTDGKDGINGIDGTNGKEIEIQKTDLYIQWRYKGGEWQNLVALADILGPSGQNGTNGEDGRTPEFRVNGNQLQWRYEGETIWLNLYDLSVLKGADGKDGSCAGYFAANGSVYSAGKALPFTVKKKSGGLISYNASSNKITLSKGHTYSLVFSGTIAVSAKSDGKACGAALFDGYNSEMALETQTYVTAPKSDQTEKLTMAYNTIYTAADDITLTFQYTTMLLQDTNFKDARYNITIIALD